MKRQLTEWEKILASDMINRGFIFKIYKQLIQLNIKNQTNNLIKSGEKTWIENIQMASRQMKMLSITNHQRNANECHKEISPHAVLRLVTQSWLTLCDPMDCSPPGSSDHGDSPGQNTVVGFHAFFQGIFPTQGSNPGLPHCRQILYHLSHQGSPRILE